MDSIVYEFAPVQFSKVAEVARQNFALQLQLNTLHRVIINADNVRSKTVIRGVSIHYREIKKLFKVAEVTP